jgi:uncharacterized protein (TIGR03067 family)
MRSLNALLAVATLALVAQSSDDEKSDRKALQGKWQPVEASFRGGELEKVPDEEGQLRQVVFDGDSVEWRGRKLDCTLDPSKKPKQMDWARPKEGAKAETSQGIYELDGDTLKVCFALPGQARPTEFKPVAEKTIVMVLRRVKRPEK